jgi:cytochrome P450
MWFGMHKQFGSIVMFPQPFGVNSFYPERKGFVSVMDRGEVERILNDKEGNFRNKGVGTRDPFLSLVPKHIIGLETGGDIHNRMRGAAQEQLSIPNLKGKLLDNVFHHALTFEGKVEALSESGESIVVEKHIRALALDIISHSVFGKAWDAQLNYSGTNEKAAALSGIMTALHWRVSDFVPDWKIKGMTPIRREADQHIATLRAFILQQLQQIRNAGPMGDEATTPFLHDFAFMEDPVLTEEEIVNLCMTFLTMGHENVATALSWTLVFLAQHQDWQDKVRDEVIEVMAASSPDIAEHKGYVKPTWKQLSSLDTLLKCYEGR